MLLKLCFWVHFFAPTRKSKVLHNNYIYTNSLKSLFFCRQQQSCLHLFLEVNLRWAIRAFLFEFFRHSIIINWICNSVQIALYPEHLLIFACPMRTLAMNVFCSCQKITKLFISKIIYCTVYYISKWKIRTKSLTRKFVYMTKCLNTGILDLASLSVRLQQAHLYGKEFHNF